MICMNCDLEARTAILEAQVAELEKENQVLREQIVYLSRELQQSKLTKIKDSGSNNELEGCSVRSSLQPSSTKKLQHSGSAGVMKKHVDPTEEASKAYLSLIECFLDSAAVARASRPGSLSIGELFYPGFPKIPHRITDILGLHKSGPLRRPDVMLPVLQILYESMIFYLSYNTISRENKDNSLDLAKEQAKSSRDHVIEAMFNSSYEKGYLFEPQTQFWKKLLKSKVGLKASSPTADRPPLVTLFSDERCAAELISIFRSMRGCCSAFKKLRETNPDTGGPRLDDRNFSVETLTPSTLFAQKKSLTSRIYVNLLIIMLAKKPDDILASMYELLGEYDAQSYLKKFFAVFFSRNDGITVALLTLLQVEEKELPELEGAVLQLLDRVSQHLSIDQKVEEVLSKYLWEKLNTPRRISVRNQLASRYARQQEHPEESLKDGE